MENAKWCKLDNVADSIEATILQDILKNEGIESKAIYKDIAEYMKLYTGNILATEGIDILVDEKDLEKANEIIKVYRESDIYEEDEI